MTSPAGRLRTLPWSWPPGTFRLAPQPAWAATGSTSFGSVDFPELPAGPPLGLGGLPFECAELDLTEGSLLVLYTDGLIAARHHDVAAGLDGLRRALEASPGHSSPPVTRFWARFSLECLTTMSHC